MPCTRTTHTCTRTTHDLRLLCVARHSSHGMSPACSQFCKADRVAAAGAAPRCAAPYLHLSLQRCAPFFLSQGVHKPFKTANSKRRPAPRRAPYAPLAAALRPFLLASRRAQTLQAPRRSNSNNAGVQEPRIPSLAALRRPCAMHCKLPPAASRSHPDHLVATHSHLAVTHSKAAVQHPQTSTLCAASGSGRVFQTRTFECAPPAPPAGAPTLP